MWLSPGTAQRALNFGKRLLQTLFLYFRVNYMFFSPLKVFPLISVNSFFPPTLCLKSLKSKFINKYLSECIFINPWIYFRSCAQISILLLNLGGWILLWCPLREQSILPWPGCICLSVPLRQATLRVPREGKTAQSNHMISLMPLWEKFLNLPLKQDWLKIDWFFFIDWFFDLIDRLIDSLIDSVRFNDLIN